MYPHPKRRQKALTKIGMQLARALVGDDADANQLLEVAQQVSFSFSFPFFSLVLLPEYPF
jgi:hypothetical protein